MVQLDPWVAVAVLEDQACLGEDILELLLGGGWREVRDPDCGLAGGWGLVVAVVLGLALFGVLSSTRAVGFGRVDLILLALLGFARCDSSDGSLREGNQPW